MEPINPEDLVRDCSPEAYSFSSQSRSSVEIARDVVSKIGQKELKKTSELYREYLECRFNTYKYSSDVDPEKLDLDCVKKTEYVEVLRLLQMFNGTDPSQYCLAYRVEDSIEGILTAKLNSITSSVHIGCLVTAPWNLDMTSPNLEDKKPIRGVGRALMQGVYRLAESVEREKICLSPLGQSATFYTAIGMHEEEGTMAMRVGGDCSSLFSRVSVDIIL
ncbi:MAG: hypothetical protein KBC64_02665 [Simkaniaceae bacterium]|nr:hypothetical protein [Simkaniaceae bacterium]